MYTLNSAPRAQPLPPRNGTPTSSAGSSPTSPIMSNAWQDQSTTSAFNENLMAQMSHLPTQPTSLPPSFITSFLGRCFPPDLVCVDFPQALTGLDYLKDLETRRQREVTYALGRTQIDPAILENEIELCHRYPGVYRWKQSIRSQEQIIESLYTQLYIGVRRWVSISVARVSQHRTNSQQILINELSLSPFNKHNCVAMLNTLYPPFGAAPPYVKISDDNLKKQRDGFFKYISAVDKNGPRVLTNVINQGMVQGDDNGWAPIVRQLQMYLQLANSMINECCNVHDLEDLEPLRHGKHAKSKTDSAISMGGSDKRPSTSRAVTSPEEHSRPKTPSIGRGTALEKLARGLKTIGRSRTDVTEISPKEEMFVTSPPKPHKSLRKMRSMGDRSLRSAQGRDSPAFDVEEMRRQRLAYEAGQQRMATGRSFEI